MPGRQAGHGDARGLYGEDLGDTVLPEEPVKLGSQPVQQLHVQLVVEKGIHLQHLPWANLAVPQDAVFQQFHIWTPPHSFFCIIPNPWPVCKGRGKRKTSAVDIPWGTGYARGED